LTRSWADIEKKRILFWFTRGVWLSIIGGQDFSLANYVSLRKKAGQGINIKCDTMQAAKILLSQMQKQVTVIPHVKK
jgi:hypothetical protein